jgi:bacterioferritin-associated ferredoxin
MLICVCNAIREKDFRSAVRDGARSPCAAYSRLGSRPKCGQCLPFARDVLVAERAQA